MGGSDEDWARRWRKKGRRALRLAVAAVMASWLATEAFGQAPLETAARPPSLEVSVAYTAEGWAVAGGRDEGNVYVDNLDLGLRLDLERFGWEGATFSVSGLYNNRNQLSEKLIGDFQAASNIDADGSPRLYELWLEQRFGGFGRAKVGVIDLNEEFDVNETGALFVNSSHGIAPDFSQVGANGPSIFPAPGLGALVEADSGGWTMRFGAFEGVPRDPDRPRRTVFGLTRGEGVLFVLEGQHAWNGGRALIGLRHHSGDFEPWPGQNGVPGQRENSTGAYFLVEDGLARVGGLALRGFGRIGLADRRIHEVSAYAGAGLILQGPLLGLDDEQVGVAFASARSGRPFRRTIEEGNGASHETSLELTYSGALLPWLTVQPNVQWITNPGFSRRIPDALALGLRVTASVSWSPSSGR
ncbi:MAG: carbohydrate porin [Pseudomonadota bacterium]|nr:carbohydrate porin [Pseudomonadota bacterium]